MTFYARTVTVASSTRTKLSARGPTYDSEAFSLPTYPFTVATLIIFAYNIVLGTTALYLVLVSSGAGIVWANCLWGFLSLWLLIYGGLLTGAFDAICEVVFNPIFDGLMKAAVAGYEKVSVVDEAIRSLYKGTR